MTYGPLTDVLRYIRRIALRAEVADLDDARLLARFLEQRDEAAFEALLRRHGPMVLGVCRRLLRDGHDIEDAFQATFLVLLRRARSLRKRELVANWLYGVAYRIALKARTETALHRVHAKPIADVPGEASEDDVEWKDLRTVLDEEVQRLPAKYRKPVVLCYLEGKTVQEAAHQLGWPAGTVSGRLARAKQLLRTRLTRRGVGLTAGPVGTALSQTASGVLPVSLRMATANAALALATRYAEAAALIPASVVTLMEGVLHAMFFAKIKTAATLLLIAAVISGGAGLVTYQKLAAQAANQQEAGKQKAVALAQPPAIEQKAEVLDPETILKKMIEAAPEAIMTPDDDLKKMLAAVNVDPKMETLLWDRLEAAKTVVSRRWKELYVGRGTLDIYLNSSRRLLEAELDLSSSKADHVAARDTHR
jgi:RNA polymerase sigma factor (sigma-70 family)